MKTNEAILFIAGMLAVSQGTELNDALSRFTLKEALIVANMYESGVNQASEGSELLNDIHFEDMVNDDTD